MRSYIFSGFVILLMTSAEAQCQGRADRQYSRRSNVATLKLAPKKQSLPENSSTKRPVEPQKKSTYPPTRLWSQGVSPRERGTTRDRNWENYYPSQLEGYQKQQAERQSRQHQAHGNSKEHYIPDAPIRATQKTNRKSGLQDSNSVVLDAPWRSRFPVRPAPKVIGDPNYVGRVEVEEVGSLTTLAWPAETPGFTALLSSTTAPIIVPVSPTVPPTTITGLPMAATATPMSLTVPTILPARLTSPPVTINMLPIAETTMPTSQTALTIAPAPPTVPPLTLNVLPMAGTGTQALPTVNSPPLRSTTWPLPIEGSTPAMVRPPPLSDSVPTPAAGRTNILGTTDGLFPVPMYNY